MKKLAIVSLLLLSVSPVHAFGRSGNFQKGFTYLKWGRQFPDHAERSFRTLAETGTEWVSFVPIYYVDDIRSTNIYKHPVLSPSDEQLAASIAEARAKGFKILLKPHIDVMRDPWKAEWSKGEEAWLAKYRKFVDDNPIATSLPEDPNSPTTPDDGQDGRWKKNWFRQLFEWRGYIHAGSSEGIKQWFANYTDWIVHYARLAQELGVEQFCVGTELERLVSYTKEWESVIQEVRKVYSGELLYDTNHGNLEGIKFWNKLDYIGISAYYPLAAYPGASESQMRQGLNRQLDTIEKFLNKQKFWYWRDFPVLFSEAGYTDFKGTSVTPWDFLLTQGVSLEEQALAYKVSLDLYPKRKWLRGVFFWRWSVEPEDPYFDYDHYTPYGKPAEHEIRRAWTGR